MEPANQKKLQEHLKAITGILYQEAKTEELESLAGIERTIRAQGQRLHFWQEIKSSGAVSDAIT